MVWTSPIVMTQISESEQVTFVCVAQVLLYRSLLAVSSQIPRTLCCLFVRLKMNSMLLDKWRKEGSSPALHTSDGR